MTAWTVSVHELGEASLPAIARSCSAPRERHVEPFEQCRSTLNVLDQAFAQIQVPQDRDGSFRVLQSSGYARLRAPVRIGDRREEAVKTVGNDAPGTISVVDGDLITALGAIGRRPSPRS